MISIAMKVDKARQLLEPTIAVVGLLLLNSIAAWAQVTGYQYDEVSTQGHFFKLMTGGFGSFIMIFMGMGGFATLFVTRQGKKGRNVPIIGVVMLLIAGGMFAFRVMVRAGVFGHEYLEW